MHWHWNWFGRVWCWRNLTIIFLLFLAGWDWREFTWYCGQYWPIVPAPDDRWWWLWSNWWNEDWQGKQKHSEKTCPNAASSPQIPRDLPRAPTRAVAVGSQRLTAWAMAWPNITINYARTEPPPSSPSTHYRLSYCI
jgi:hypothetical protein